ncbi:hypothetical protein FPV67DRAFT_1445822 [Lyophyllum atratum]|nr:hypothetical protein FPV67DRAFT_1445822 [Lyophyllum atratum]
MSGPQTSLVFVHHQALPAFPIGPTAVVLSTPGESRALGLAKGSMARVIVTSPVHWALPKALWRTRSGSSYSPYSFAPYQLNTVARPILYQGLAVAVNDNFDALMHGAMQREPVDGDDAKAHP